MTRRKNEYGVLLPHFGSQATRERIVEASVAIEEYGFDSVWVRDHLVFVPHAHEDPDRTFVDPFVALSAVAAVTKRITLATGSLVPHRHPVHAALLIGSLDFIAGPGRLLIGWGLGTYEHEFTAAAMGGWDRRRVLPEQVEIARRLLAGEAVTFKGEFYELEDVQIRPIPSQAVPIWYCGISQAAVRRAVEYCDGWIPGSMPRNAFRQRLARMRRLAEEAGVPVPPAGVIPWVSPGPTVEEASRALDEQALLTAFAARGYVPEDKEKFESLADLGGGVMAGPADVIVEHVRKYQEAGAQHLVFDLRLRFDDWEYCLDYLGREVLPVLRRGDEP
jgi:probable F420-dependent oxidoreductase